MVLLGWLADADRVERSSVSTRAKPSVNGGFVRFRRLRLTLHFRPSGKMLDYCLAASGGTVRGVVGRVVKYGICILLGLNWKIGRLQKCFCFLWGWLGAFRSALALVFLAFLILSINTALDHVLLEPLWQGFI